MKTVNYILFAALLITSSCKKKNMYIFTDIEFSLNKPQEINSATFTVTKIIDNRCPINTDCTTAGKAEAYITVVLNGEVRDLVLCIGGDCKSTGLSDFQTLTISSVNYAIKLMGVNPYNNPGTDTESKTAKLQIARQS